VGQEARGATKHIGRETGWLVYEDKVRNKKAGKSKKCRCLLGLVVPLRYELVCVAENAHHKHHHHLTAGQAPAVRPDGNDPCVQMVQNMQAFCSGLLGYGC
jgi:hypothetical protein